MMNNSAASEIASTLEVAMVHDIENQSGEGSRGGRHSDRRLMYRTVLSNDWSAVSQLLKKDQSLAYGELSERGDRALHLSIIMKHKKLARKLIELMDPSELEIRDGCGNTACCYAAISARMVKIARLLITKNRRVAALRNAEKLTPLQTACLSGKDKMILFLFEQTPNDCLSQNEWFVLLLDAISTKLYDLALRIVARDGSLATMRSGEGTALHQLARQDISKANTSKMAILLKTILGTTFCGRKVYGEMQPDRHHLAKMLLAKIQEHSMHVRGALELLRSPPVLLDAAKKGNVDLIVLIAREYPELLWQKDSYNRSIFHIAVMYRQENVFSLIKKIVGSENDAVTGMDADKNTILHLVAKSGHANARKNKVGIPPLQMQKEIVWFKEVEAIVPRTFLGKQNGAGKKPREIFSEEHQELLRESKAWVKSTASSCMVIATLVLTVVFGVAFIVPGSQNLSDQLSSILTSPFLYAFYEFNALALLGSVFCIVVFWSLTWSGFEEEKFLDVLPCQLKFGVSCLFGSLFGTISAFMSAYSYMLVGEGATVISLTVFLLYLMVAIAIWSRFFKLWGKMRLPKDFPPLQSSRNIRNLFSGI